MTRLAIGVLAAKAPQILERTLRHWDAHDTPVYVHVDAKIDIEPFRFVEEHRYARLIWSRQKIMWAGFNMVVAEMALMREAVTAGPFDWFVLHSDDTVPLLSVPAMIDRLERPENWLENHATDHHNIMWRYETFLCNDISPCNPRAGDDRGFIAEDFKTLADMRFLMDRGKEPLKQVNWASQWKSLPYSDVITALAEFDSNSRLTQSFRFSSVPDEHYILTVLARAGTGRVVANYLWADFSRHPAPHVFTDIDDLHEAFVQRYAFVRKVHDPEVADRIMARSRELAEPATG